MPGETEGNELIGGGGRESLNGPDADCVLFMRDAIATVRAEISTELQRLEENDPGPLGSAHEFLIEASQLRGAADALNRLETLIDPTGI